MREKFSTLNLNQRSLNKMKLCRCNKYQYFIFPKNDRTRVHYRDNFPDIRITFLLLEIQLYIVEYSSNILRVETDGSHHHICAVGNKICPCTMAWATHSDRKIWLHLWYYKTNIRSLSENALEPTQFLFLVLNSYLL